MNKINQIIIINGPNLNLLGKRDPEVYGHISFEEYFLQLQEKFPDIKLEYYQSNHEGGLIDKLHQVGFEDYGIVINPGGYTHTSIALRDAVDAITAPVIEVHISNIYERETFRHFSFLKDVCKESIVGKGLAGYDLALEKLTA